MIDSEPNSFFVFGCCLVLIICRAVKLTVKCIQRKRPNDIVYNNVTCLKLCSCCRETLRNYTFCYEFTDFFNQPFFFHSLFEFFLTVY